MELIATVIVLNEDAPEENCVPPRLECPRCGETRMEWIQPLDDDRFECLRCGPATQGSPRCLCLARGLTCTLAQGSGLYPVCSSGQQG